ncbi:hypothetical protein ACT7DH_24360 [Bacillus pacificus]
MKRNLFKNLMDLIQHIAVDFEKYDLNFDIMYEKIEGYKHNKEGRSYQEYRNMLIEKYRIGLIKKNKKSFSITCVKLKLYSEVLN